MSLVQTLRSLDFVSATRAWPTAHETYRTHGLVVGEKTEEESPSLASLGKVEARRVADDAFRAIERGEDAIALRSLSAAWETPEYTISGLLGGCAVRMIVLRHLERALALLQKDADRLGCYLAWLDAASPLDLGRGLRGEAARMAGAPAKGWARKAMMSRHMEAWTRLFDATDGFQALPTEIATKMLEIADEPGMSRLLVQTSFPIFAHTMNSFTELADRQRDLRGLFVAAIG